ncbi:MAG: acetoin utilization protein AcuC [Magnetovibrionaceae bacterium]
MAGMLMDGTKTTEREEAQGRDPDLRCRDQGPRDQGPWFIGSEIYRDSSYGRGHPLAIPRVSVTIDMARAMGWLDEAHYIDSPRATPEDLARFHEPAYIDALMRAEFAQAVSAADAKAFNIGTNGNPVYGEMFQRPATAAGAARLSGQLLADGGVVFSPAGGTHHGRKGGASGFCYFNDPVLAILSLQDQGVKRIFYLDLDAHWGDGVQLAFAESPEVFTLSVHENARWPMARDPKAGIHGSLDDLGPGHLNLPVPRGFTDVDLGFLMDALILPLIEDFAPEALVLQLGCDGLADDPQSKLCLSNRGLWRALEACRPMSPRLLVLGGGGYNPYAVGRCWAGYWGVLTGQDLEVPLTPEAKEVLRALTWDHRKGRQPLAHWFTHLADPVSFGGENVSEDVRALSARASVSLRHSPLARG